MQILSNEKLRGFTVGEVVLSSFIMTMGIVSVLGLINFSFKSSVEAQDIIVASELAQEGVELARNIRDNALVDKMATELPVDVFTGFPTGANSHCAIDYNDTSFDCGSPIITLTLNANGYYQHESGENARFYRMLKIDHTGGSDTARVKSFVTWQDPGNNLNGGGDTAWCTLINKCVYTEVFLTQWK